MTETSWRKQFVELSEGIFRELGFPPPAMLHEDSLPLAMELEVDKVSFELLHAPDFQPHRILITCLLGKLPERSILTMLYSLLKSNLGGARNFSFWFGVHPETADVTRLEYQELSDIHPASLLDRLRSIARDSAGWTDGQLPSRQDESDELADNLRMSLA
jgi:hypothetical protein